MPTPISFVAYTDKGKEHCEKFLAFNRRDKANNKKFSREEVEEIIKRQHYQGYIAALHDLRAAGIISF